MALHLQSLSSELWVCSCRLSDLGQVGIGQHPELPLGSFHIQLPPPSPWRASYQTVSKFRADSGLPEAAFVAREKQAVGGKENIHHSNWEQEATPPFFCPLGLRPPWQLILIVRATDWSGPSGPCTSPRVLSYAQAMWKQALLDFRMRNKQPHWDPLWGRCIIT